MNRAYRCAVSQIFKPFSLYICKHSAKLFFFVFEIQNSPKFFFNYKKKSSKFIDDIQKEFEKSRVVREMKKIGF